MERLFSPCTRLDDASESQGGLDQERINELDIIEELNLNASTEELLSAERAFTYGDLYALLGNEDTETLAWLTPHSAIARNVGRAMIAWDHQLGRSYRFRFSADGTDMFALARSSEQLLEICDVVLRLLAVSVVDSLRLTGQTHIPHLCINTPNLAYLMEQCQSLKVLTLEFLEIDEDYCRVLGAYSRLDLEIVLDRCKTTSAGASVLAEVLRRNQGPTKLDQCYIGNSVLANGLRGNSRLKSLRPRNFDSDVGEQELVAIASALKVNKGLVDLKVTCHGLGINDFTWGAICDSIKAHPTLEVLDFADSTTWTNRLRPRVSAIQKTRPITYRAKVLGRALYAVRTNPNRF
jgi:hypothetical protein